ncbi:MAG: AMP-binding protein [Gemmatimonadota bacterium]
MSIDPDLTTAHLLLARAGDPHPGLLFEDRCWSWAEVVDECTARAHWLLERRDPSRPFHVGVMLENEPEYLFLIGGAALAGAAVVGVNLTRRGAELAGDIRFTDCQLVVTSTALAPLLAGLDTGAVIVPHDEDGYRADLRRCAGRPAPEPPADPRATLLLLFTSGSTGRPKAVICSTGRFAAIAQHWHMDLGRDDVSYNAMPLFHGNALMAGWASPLATGGTYALARRFSASRFLDDVISFRATYFNYVGRSLAYILAQPERPEERQHRLRCCFGTEASSWDRAEFERRFGVAPTESYGSSEGALTLRRAPGAPPDSLGLPPPGMAAAVLDPATMRECPRARFDSRGLLLNSEEAIGELASLHGAAAFEGYYKNPDAEAQRVRGQVYLTGDLGYRDEQGWFYFAGRGIDWLRVDSENFAAAPVERILSRFPGVGLVAVYPVPDERTGDQVMAAIQLAGGAGFDAAAFGRFLAEQPDLGTKWAPRYVRLVASVPVTATRKIDKLTLRRERWEVTDPVYHRPAPDLAYQPLTAAGRARIRQGFAAFGRENLLR